MRPPTLKARALSSHLSATFTRTSSNFWTSSSFADLSVFPSLLCDFCPSDQEFAYSFLQIPPHDGHPCLRLYPSHHRADSGLAPVRNVRRRAHTKKETPKQFLLMSLHSRSTIAALILLLQKSCFQLNTGTKNICNLWIT